MHYLIAVDDSHNSLEEIVKVKALYKLRLPKQASFISDWISHHYPSSTRQLCMCWVLERFKKSLMTVCTLQRNLRYNFMDKIHISMDLFNWNSYMNILFIVLCFYFPKRADLACLSINLNIETVLLKRRLNVRWVCESGIVKNIDHVVEEYRQTKWLLVSVQLCAFIYTETDISPVYTYTPLYSEWPPNSGVDHLI